MLILGSPTIYEEFLCGGAFAGGSGQRVIGRNFRLRSIGGVYFAIVSVVWRERDVVLVLVVG